MRLDEIREIIIDSDRETHWHEVDVGPYFTDAPDSDTGAFEQHQTLLVFRADVDLTIQWGMKSRQHGQIDTVTNLWPHAHFPDDEAFVEYADLFWRGSLIDREQVVVVDGGRAILPLGTRQATNYDTTNVDAPADLNFEYAATRWQTSLARLLDSGREFDAHFERAGLIVKG